MSIYETHKEWFPGTIVADRASLSGGSHLCYGTPKRRGAVGDSRDVQWEFYGAEWTNDLMDKAEEILTKNTLVWASNYWELWAEGGRFWVRRYTWKTRVGMNTPMEFLHKLAYLTDARMDEEKRDAGMTFEPPSLGFSDPFGGRVPNTLS